MGYHMNCAEIWGGIDDIDQDLETGALKASLFSRAAEGGKGGDIYYFSVCGNDQITRIVVADVSGHGPVVSRTSRWIYDAIQEHINNLSGNELLARLNNTVEVCGTDAMTTAAVATVFVRDSSVFFTYAGHPPILYWRKRDGVWRHATARRETRGWNYPLGTVRDINFDQHSFALESGDQMFLYTDGVLEAPDPEGREFGAERLMTALNDSAGRTPSELKRFVVDKLSAHTGGRLDHDDFTVMAVEVLPRSA